MVKIERLYEKNGQQMLYGNRYLRPDETYHVQTRRFLEKEVFKSDKYVNVALEEIKDRCCVLTVKQYFTMKPEGKLCSVTVASQSLSDLSSRSIMKVP